MHINDLLKVASERKASDLHLKVGSHPVIRIAGELVPLVEMKRLMQEDTIAMAFSIMSNRQKQKFKDNLEIDIAYSVPGLGRFRANVFQQRGTVGLVLRVIPGKILTIRELGLPLVLEKIAQETRGLLLCTGTTGSGKSTTLAAMIDYINSHRCEHIMTIEKAILAGGCFWGMQDLIRKLPGVISTRVGYTGGDVPNATYRNHHGHAEAIEITNPSTDEVIEDLAEHWIAAGAAGNPAKAIEFTRAAARRAV